MLGSLAPAPIYFDNPHFLTRDQWLQPKVAMAKYEAHNAEVRRRVPRSQLLVYSVDQGWGPLCKFLDLPIPDQPFPNLNDQHMFRRFCRVLLGASVVLPCLATIIVAWALSRVARRLAAR